MVDTIKKILFAVMICVFLSCCQKPKNADVSSEEVFENIIDISSLKEEEIFDLTEIKDAQRYGIAADKIKDGYAVLNPDGINADNIIVLRAADDKAVDALEEALLSYVNDLSAVWEFNETESKKIENRVFKTIDKFILLYIGSDYEEAERIFDNMVID